MAQVPEQVAPPARWRVAAAAFVLLAAGCAAAPPPPAAPPLAVTRDRAPPAALRVHATAREGAGDLAIARVGGTEIRRSDIGDFAIRFYRDQANEILTHLIDERIIDAEAKRLAVVLPDGLLDREVARELKERERSVKVEFGAETDFSEYLRDRYGVTLKEHRQELGRLLRTRLLRDRVIRMFEVRTERVEVRDGVFPTEAAADAAARAVRGGADLARIAKESGARPAVVMPPVVRGEISPPSLERAVFALAVGEVSEPISVTEGGDTLWHVFKLVRRDPARDVLYSAVRTEVEDGLEKEPIQSYEYLQWARQMRDRYGVEILK